MLVSTLILPALTLASSVAAVPAAETSEAVSVHSAAKRDYDFLTFVPFVLCARHPVELTFATCSSRCLIYGRRCGDDDGSNNAAVSSASVASLKSMGSVQSIQSTQSLTSIASVASANSLTSIASLKSVASLQSIQSTQSLTSIVSAASVTSLASLASLNSVASVQSVQSTQSLTSLASVASVSATSAATAILSSQSVASIASVCLQASLPSYSARADLSCLPQFERIGRCEHPHLLFRRLLPLWLPELRRLPRNSRYPSLPCRQLVLGRPPRIVRPLDSASVLVRRPVQRLLLQLLRQHQRVPKPAVGVLLFGEDSGSGCLSRSPVGLQRRVSLSFIHACVGLPN